MADDLVTKELFPDLEEEQLGGIGGISFLNWIAEAGTTLPPHWSPARDQELRRFWKSSDHLSSAVSILRDMATTMEFKIVPRDTSIKSHHRVATKFQEALTNKTESRGNFSARGWATGYGPAIQDLYSQDNGMFLAIEGQGIRIENPLGTMSEGPLVPGGFSKLIHLDSYRCWRTTWPQFPVLYTDIGGKQFLLHKSRVVVLAGQSDPNSELLGVGFCAVSRAAGAAQNLIDMSNYKQEKLGSRPKRAILFITGGNKNAVKAISNQLKKADEETNNRGFKRYGPLPIIGLRAGSEPTLMDLNSIPDGFNERESTELDVIVLAGAFGVDPRQLGFALGLAGQTKADAVVQHSKMQGKGPAAVRADVKKQLEDKVLPPFLMFVWIHKDDLADKAKAENAKIRAETREINLRDGVTTVRMERENMVKEETMTDEQFVQAELEDGRLESGEDILVLFQSSEMQELLSIGLDASPEEIDNAIVETQGILMSTSTAGVRGKVKLALVALEALRNSKVMTEELEDEDKIEEENNGR